MTVAKSRYLGRGEACVMHLPVTTKGEGWRVCSKLLSLQVMSPHKFWVNLCSGWAQSCGCARWEAAWCLYTGAQLRPAWLKLEGLGDCCRCPHLAVHSAVVQRVPLLLLSVFGISLKWIVSPRVPVASVKGNDRMSCIGRDVVQLPA